MSFELDRKLYKALEDNISLENMRELLDNGANPRSEDYMEMTDFPHMLERSLHTHPCGFAIDITNKAFPTVLSALVEAGFNVNERFFYRQRGKVSFVEFGLSKCVEKMVKSAPEQQTFDKIYLPNISHLLKTSWQQRGENMFRLKGTLYYVLLISTNGRHVQELEERGWKIDHFIGFLEMLSQNKEFADWNFKGVRGMTPLHLLSFIQTEHYSHAIIQCALSHGADIESKDVFGFTPLHICCVLGNVNMAKSLLELGASMTATTNFTWTPIDIARRGSYNFVTYDSGLVKIQTNLLQIFDVDPNIHANATEGNAIHPFEKELEAIGALLKNDVEEFKRLRGNCIDFMKCLLSSGELGPLCPHTPIAETVFRQVQCLMSRLVSHAVKLDPQFECELNLTGSNAEGTKLNRPDEFDYNVVLTKLSECDISRYCHPRHGEVCYVLNDTNTPSSYWKKFCFEDNEKMIINTVLLRTYFIDLLNQGLSKSETWEGLDLYWRTSGVSEGQTLELMWTGHVYPDMDISIDIMTFVKLSQWPYDCLDPACGQLVPEYMISHSSYLVQKKYFFVLTASKLELHVIKNLPLVPKYAYVLCKAIMKLLKMKVKQLPIPKLGQNGFSLSKMIPSTYAMKNATFYVWSDILSGRISFFKDKDKSLMVSSGFKGVPLLCLAEHLQKLSTDELEAIQKVAMLILDHTSFKYYKEMSLHDYCFKGWERYFFNPEQPHLWLRPSLIFNIDNIKKREILQKIIE